MSRFVVAALIASYRSVPPVGLDIWVCRPPPEWPTRFHRADISQHVLAHRACPSESTGTHPSDHPTPKPKSRLPFPSLLARHLSMSFSEDRRRNIVCYWPASS